MLRLFSIALLLVSAFAYNAQAGILSPLVGLGPIQLEDDDWETQITGTGDGRLDVGDKLLAVIQIGQSLDLNGATIQTYSPSTATITGISVIKVKTLVVNGAVATYTFEGLTSAEWLGLGFAGVSDGTAAILYEDPASAPGNHIDFSTVANGVATATEGLKIAEFSIVSAGGWEATSVDLTNDPTNVSKIDILNFRAGLVTNDNRFGLHNTLSTLGQTADDQAFFLGLGDVDLQLTGQIGQGPKGGFALRTDSDLFVSIVPEPSSLAVFSLLGGLALGFRRRK